jgi:organic hydroperoxide reductase OsmC/OhrA
MVTELIKPLYTAEATAVGGRDGHATGISGWLDLDIKPPEAMGGTGEPWWPAVRRSAWTTPRSPAR